MQRASSCARGPLFVQDRGDRERVRIDLDDASELWVDALDPLEIHLGDLHRRALTRIHRCAELGDGLLFNPLHGCETTLSGRSRVVKLASDLPERTRTVT